MFWRRNKPMKVELLTPIHLTAPPAPAHIETVNEHAAKEAKINTDLAFKLITYGAVTSQAALVIYGYLLIVGRFRAFGIDPNELSLSTPALLLHGYTSSFSGVLDVAEKLPIVGVALLPITFALVAVIYLTVIAKKPKANVVSGLAPWMGIFMFIAFLAPAASIRQGMNTGLSDFERYTQQQAVGELEAVDVVVTDKGERLAGHLILADSKNTFILVGRTLFKLDGTTGRVIREAELKQRPVEMEKPPPKG
ncbi:hypothetical protein C4J96_0182 [Pseudomonas orientalis]|uniref:hypothetical protein n=1 Tax=Pseudomonas orientalis TaxID=76758 RepID=UPI000F57EBA0|nr:hypothetical protein [Pseudomonas orientalis]AZE92333.1 hypothetical protein C4J96_0182 [Pseudomonas orientalis]